MQEPTVRTSRLAIAGGLLAAAALGGAGFAIGRATAPRPAPAPPVTLVMPTPAPAPTPGEPTRLDRAGMIALAQRAADAFTTSEAAPEASREIVGRRFDLVLPFGCAGAAGDGSVLPMQWRYDEEAETLRISVMPQTWRAAEWGGGEAAETVAEGFWIARPWSSGERCPERTGEAMATATMPVTLPGQTLAVAQFLPEEGEGGDSRPRNGRPYEIVQRVPADRFDSRRGFHLRVRGRIASTPGGGPVRCVQPAGAEQRPICVIAIRMDEVSVENPATDEVLAEWPIRSAR